LGCRRASCIPLYRPAHRPLWSSTCAGIWL
jgi:hypothetical protein